MLGLLRNATHEAGLLNYIHVNGVDFLRGDSGNALRDGLRGLIDAYDADGAGQVDTTSFVQQLVTARGYSSPKKKLQVARDPNPPPAPPAPSSALSPPFCVAPGALLRLQWHAGRPQEAPLPPPAD